MPLIRFRVLLGQMAANYSVFRLCLGQCHAGPEPRHNSNARMRFAVLHNRTIVLADWSEQIDLSRQSYARGRYTDNRVGLAIKDNLPPDGFWISAVEALPQAIADDDDRRCAGPIFAWQKCATSKHASSQDGKKFG